MVVVFFKWWVNQIMCRCMPLKNNEQFLALPKPNCCQLLTLGRNWAGFTKEAHAWCFHIEYSVKFIVFLGFYG